MSIVAETATVAWDYTLADIDRFAAIAIRKSYASHLLDPIDQRDHAWFGVVDALYSATLKPSEWDLIKAGMYELADAVKDQLHHHGRTNRDQSDAPMFSKFWTSDRNLDDGFSERIAERVALPQMLGVLTDLQYEAIVTLASCGSMSEAGRALGITAGAFQQRVAKARTRAKEVWYAPETPPGTTRLDRDVACRYGHSRREHGYKTGDGVWRCRRCDRDKMRRRRARGEG